MQKNSKKPLIILFAISILPFLMAWVLYHYAHFFPFKTLNHGQFIDPPVKSQPHPKWEILYIHSLSCQASCKNVIHQLHQLRKALGKDSERVDIIDISNQADQETSLFRGLLARKLPLLETIYLVDPAGNLFMCYPSSVDPMNILKDMKRVLEVSQIG